MNIDIIKEELKQHLDQPIEIKVFKMRNKINTYQGILKRLYPNIFTIISNNIEKSFNYRDIITKDIIIKYK